MKILLFILPLLFLSCGQNETKQKELELKERELALKEKELSLKYKDTVTSKSFSGDTVSLNPKVAPEEKIELPFLGTKYFNFMGGSGTGQSITITKDGTVILKSYGAPEAGTDPSINYKGKYAKIIKVNKDEIYKIEGNKIYMVNAKGVVEKGCEGEGIPCISGLN
ncbi:MAG: hypothetical protein IPP81_19955 [Chitinophagaceae bacterium]|nr:hypothetical protein [Chitinophagaceae bacterium]